MSDIFRKPDAAASVASFIGVVKWTLIVLYVVGAIITVLVVLSSGDNLGLEAVGARSDDTSMHGPVIAGAVAWAVVGSLVTWVLFGWFQHTLGMLAMIARNTQQQPVQYQG